MRYGRRQEFTALLSILSVTVSLTSGVLANVTVDGFVRPFTFLTAGAAVLAALAAFMSIMVSRHLARERKRHGVFLIYAREDLEAARRLAAELRQHGFDTWFDVEEITPGQVWQTAVIRALTLGGSKEALDCCKIQIS